MSFTLPDSVPTADAPDVFVATDDKPGALRTIANPFLLNPFVDAFQDHCSPLVDAPAFSSGKLAFVAAWGVVGGAVTVKKFSWEPSGSAPRGRRSKQAAAS